MEEDEGFQTTEDMIKIEYKGWDEVSISLYNEISKICGDDNLEALDKNIKLIALLSDTPEDKIWDLELEELKPLLNDIAWLWKFDFKKKNRWKGNKININGKPYTICTDLERFTISQYIDFQMIWPTLKNSDDNYAQILSTFIIPEGKKYNKDYDLKEVIKEIDENLSITQANSVLYFFLLCLARSIRATEICYKVLMKILKMRTKTKQDKEQMKEIEERTLEMIKEARLILGSL